MSYSVKFMSVGQRNITGFLTTVVLLAASHILCGPSASAAQKTFSNSDQAVQALIEAVKSGEKKSLLDLLGKDYRNLVSSGDKVADRQSSERFIQLYQEANRQEKLNDNKVILHVGNDDWPFPIPIVRQGGTWYFDTEQGAEEIINRRVGRNELFTIQTCLAYMDAQREYYVRNPTRDTLLHYAQKFVSSNGRRDGLYWETAPGEEPSPLGPRVTTGRSEGYFGNLKNPAPYHGYYFKILTAQGPDAPGGAYDYVVNGKMMGGFGLVAYPAEYGSSGVMTFIVNHEGQVYQKDLGKRSASIARAMKEFNPDPTWQKASPSDWSGR
jgi:hypothetical protein